MPFQVRVTQGDDARVIDEKLSDADAHDVAKRVSAATGETVELVPYLYDEKTAMWTLADEPSTTITITPNDDETAVGGEEAPDFDEMTGDQLNEFAAKHEVDGYKKSSKVAERVAALGAWFKEKKSAPAGDATSIETMTTDQLDTYAENLRIPDWDIDQSEDAKRAAIVAFISA